MRIMYIRIFKSFNYDLFNIYYIIIAFVRKHFIPEWIKFHPAMKKQKKSEPSDGVTFHMKWDEFLHKIVHKNVKIAHLVLY